MSNPQNSNSIPKLSLYAIRAMLAFAVIACIFVIVQSCSLEQKPSLTRFAKGELKKLEVLRPAPPQPQMTFITANGEKVSLEAFRGKTFVLNIWATWCVPCIAEIPSLDLLQEQRGGTDFTVVAISMDRHIDDANAFLKANDINNLALYHDPTYSISAKLGVDGIPISIFYDRNGHEIARIAGEVNWQSAEVLALLDTILINN